MQHRIQIIHCNEQETYPIGQYLARLCGLPVVVSVHFRMPRPYCEYLFQGPRRPRRIFFVSQSNQEACREGVDGLIPGSDWRVLPNGLDFELYRPDRPLGDEYRRQLGLGSELVLGVACALRPRKQLEHVFEAVARLKVPNVRLLLAGGAMAGEEAYAEQLIGHAKAQLGDRIVHLGRLSDLRGFYNALDLFINTSQEESFGISVLEAMAYACPVVGYPSHSVQEVILPGGGEIVEQDRVDLLISCMERWLSNPTKLAAARIDARKRAEGTYDIQKISNQLLAEYQALLA